MGFNWDTISVWVNQKIINWRESSEYFPYYFWLPVYDWKLLVFSSIKFCWQQGSFFQLFILARQTGLPFGTKFFKHRTNYQEAMLKNTRSYEITDVRIMAIHVWYTIMD